jgi:endonuclease YncB( thermonuclease family)
MSSVKFLVIYTLKIMTSMELFDGASKKTPEFSLRGMRCLAKCVDCYDGDTCKVVFPFHGELTRWTIRVYGVNTSEIRGGSDEEKKMGILARDFTRKLVLDKMVWVSCYGFGKYGRLVADIYFDEQMEGPTLSDMLIEAGHSEPYMRTEDN